MRGFRFVLLAIAFTLYASVVARADNTFANTYARVRHSLALVVRQVSKRSVVMGTAFCIYSDANHAIYLTNRHVVGGASTVLLALEGQRPVDATVIRTSSVEMIDAAILDAPTPEVVPLAFSRTPPREGDDIAVAGYPTSQIDLAEEGLGLTPSVYRGTVTALPAGRLFIEYDAHSEHGNSGSPIFGPASGVVYGMETWVVNGSGAVNVAIGANALAPFLNESGVKLATAVAPSHAVATTHPSHRNHIDYASCKKALSNLRSGLTTWRTTFYDYTDEDTALVTAMNGLNLRDHTAVGNTLAAAQKALGTVDYAINVVEPSLQNARQSIDATGAVNTAKYVDGLVDTIAEYDYYTHRDMEGIAVFYEHAYLGDRRYAAAPDYAAFNAVEALQSITYAIKNYYPTPCHG